MRARPAVHAVGVALTRIRIVPLVLALCVSLPLAPARAAQIEVVRGLVYAARAGTPLRLDAYLPPGAGPHPAVVLLHGGSWAAGSRGEMEWAGRAFARRGFAAFAVDYRLAPAHPHPAALRDAQSAVRWIRARAARLLVHPAQVGAFGVSAGGHLAALLAVEGQGPVQRGGRVRAAVSWSGPMDLVALPRQARLYEGGWLGATVDRYAGCAGGGCEGAHRAASPVAHVDPSDGAILLAGATRERVPFAQAETMAAALEASGVPHRVVEVAGSTHGALGALEDERSLQTVWEASVSFLQTWLAADRPAAARVASSTEADPLRAAARFVAFLAAAVAACEVPRYGRAALSMARRRRLRAIADGAALSRIEALVREGADGRAIGSAVVAGRD